jgi:hypothetical protein
MIFQELLLLNELHMSLNQIQKVTKCVIFYDISVMLGPLYVLPMSITGEAGHHNLY